MKITVVPAQVTTLEDKIVGNLTLPQLLILTAPIFGDTLLYVILPPVLRLAVYKFILFGLFFIVCSLLAIRVRGRLVVDWLLVVVRYNFRPQYYLYDKQSRFGRERPQKPKENTEAISNRKFYGHINHHSLSVAQIIQTQKRISEPGTMVNFTAKKGGLYVRITQVKPQN